MLHVILCIIFLIPVNSYGKTTIDSEQLEVRLQEKIATFKGSVQVVSDDFNFSADLVQITFVANLYDLSKIKSIKAISGKRMINGSMRHDQVFYNFQCKEIFIDKIGQTITATDATFSTDKSSIVGGKILYNMADGKMVISGEKQVKISIEDEDKKAR